MYRPQFAYPVPKGCQLKNFTHNFDGNNVPLLASITLAPLAVTLGGIPLPLDDDHPFLWRATGTGIGGIVVGIQFREPFGHLLSSAPVLTDDYVFVFAGAPPTAPLPVAFEPELFCPAGSIVTVYFQNLDPNNPVTFSPSIDLIGFKLFEPEGCQK